MVTTSLNQIVNNMLLQRGYSLHWYLQFLLYGTEALRELSMDDLHIVNTKVLPVNSVDNTIDIPTDYLDYITVGIRVGQNVRPLVEAEGWDNVGNYDSNYNSVKYNSNTISNSPELINMLYGAYGFSQWFTTHYNNFGENTGRFFGGIPYYDTFKVLKNVNKIKLNEGLSFANVVLVYMSDGLNPDAASLITPYATQTIQEYILYKFFQNNRTYGIGETQAQYQRYVNERQKLRARMSDLSLAKLKRLVHRSSIASPKQ